MLPREHRMVHPGDFKNTIRRGSRAGNSMVVVHCRTDEASRSALVGFVVPKKAIRLASGRNRIKRQLRHLMRQRVGDFSPHLHLVIRVLPGAVDQDYHVLATQLDNALRRALRKEARKHEENTSLSPAKIEEPQDAQLVLSSSDAGGEACDHSAGEMVS